MLSQRILIYEWIVYHAVVEGGNLSIAAKKIGVSVSAVSKSLSRLEASLGATLFNRTSRGMEITDAGRITYEKSKTIISTFYSLKSELGGSEGEVSGKLRFSAPSVLCESVANEWAFDYMKRYENVEINLHSRERTDFSVHSPEFDDIVLKSGFIDSADLVHRKLTPMPMVMCATPCYLKKTKRIQVPDDLYSHDLLMLNHPSVEGLTLIKKGTKASLDFSMMKGLTTNNISAIVNLALMGRGVCIAAPEWVVLKKIESGDLRVILPDWEFPSLQPFLVWRYREYQSELMRNFRDYISDKWECLVRGG